MTSFIAVLINDLRRLSASRTYLVLYTILTSAAIAAALFMSTRAENIGHIALVANGSEPAELLSTEYLSVTLVQQPPPLSELVSGRYDAIVMFDAQGELELTTIKSDDYAQSLRAIIANPSANHTELVAARGLGESVIGFMLMFILMQGVIMMRLFAEDKEQRQIKRIATSPVSFVGYLGAHCVFTFASLLAPVMLILTAAKYALSLDLGFDLSQYLGIVSLICLLATAFSFLLVALNDSADSANMTSSLIVVLTSILAGSFYSFEKDNELLATLIKVLPQKAIFTLATHMEKNDAFSTWHGNLLYVTALCLAFIALGVAKTRQEYLKS
jgi:ABC-2 type transport system permease protein